MPKLKYEFKNYEYETFEEYLTHGAEMSKEGWRFSSQSNNHKEVTWVRDGESNKKTGWEM